MDDLSLQCVNPAHYERMVRYLRSLNPACKGSKWAMQVINTCIRRALAEDTLIALGMCVAVASHTHPGKVYLFIDPVRDCELPPIHDEPAIFDVPLVKDDNDPSDSPLGMANYGAESIPKGNFNAVQHNVSWRRGA